MPIVIGIGLLVALAFGVGAAVRPKAQSGWYPVTGGSLPLGQRYRWSASRSATGDPQVLANALESLGLEGTLVWPGDSHPVDWPADDLATGRTRVEATISGGLAPSIGPFVHLGNAPDVRVWQLRRT